MRTRNIDHSYKRFLYDSDLFIDEGGSKDAMFPISGRECQRSASGHWFANSLLVLPIDGLADLHFGSAVDAYQQVPRYRIEEGDSVDNITDWGLEQFREHYQPGRAKEKRPITKEAIFHYVYGVLHDPVYREKYAINLKREFPRIPFYADFWKWSDWGEELMNLHIGYETVHAGQAQTDRYRPTTELAKRVLLPSLC